MCLIYTRMIKFTKLRSALYSEWQGRGLCLVSRLNVLVSATVCMGLAGLVNILPWFKEQAEARPAWTQPDNTQLTRTTWASR